MTSQMFRKAYIVCIVLIGVTINVIYGVELLKELFAPQTTDTIREILISASTLQFGWAAMLFWGAFNPSERRHIILFTALTMVIGNFLYSISQVINTDVNTVEIALNLATGIFVSGLFVLAFFLSKPDSFLLEKRGPRM